MKICIKVINLLVIIFVAENSVYSQNIEEIFRKMEIIPDILTTAPEQTLKVTYANNISVENGNELTPTQVKDVPSVEWQSEPNSYYTLMLIDPDAPSRENPIARSWQHWIVTNIPESNNISAGNVITQYIGAGPPKNSGLHRYVFLLYKQAEKHVYDEPILGKSTANRAQFSVLKFCEKHNLGNPIAGNLFQAQYDDYVPILYSELNNK